MAVSPIPEGYTSVTTYLRCRDASAAIDFYRRAFNAVELMRLPMPDGRLGHAEIRIGNAIVMLADEFPEWGVLGPQSLKGCSSGMMVYTPDCDAMMDQAIKAGATLIRPIELQFYGDRSGQIRDPFGHEWSISTHVEDITAEQLQERMAEWSKTASPESK